MDDSCYCPTWRRADRPSPRSARADHAPGEDDGRAGEEADGRDDEARPCRASRRCEPAWIGRPRASTCGAANCRRSWSRRVTGGRTRMRSSSTGQSWRRCWSSRRHWRPRHCSRCWWGSIRDATRRGSRGTLQRRVKTWRAERGPYKDVVLAQLHRPGEAAQTDFTGDRVCGDDRWGAFRAYVVLCSCCPTPTGGGRASACPSRSRRFDTECNALSSSSDACPSGTRRTTPRRPRAGSPTARPPSARAAASARSTRTTSRSCGTSA